MKIELIDVAFLEEAKKGAAFPMYVDGELVTPKSINKLGQSPSGSGHDNFLKQIHVMFDITATQYEWMQLERYTFLTMNSQSKMHRLLKLLQ